MKHHRPYQMPSSLPAGSPLLPVGVDPAAVLARRQAMIDAGTHPTLAGLLARSAAGHQAQRDRDPRFVMRSEDPF